MADARRRRAPFTFLLIANALSLAGSAMTIVALPLFVLDQGRGPIDIGLTGFMNAVPMVLVGIFAGALIDRVGHWRSSVASDLLAGTALLLIPVLHDAGALTFGLLLGLVFARTLLDVPGMIARESLVPEVAAHAGLDLDRANSYYEALPRLALLLGPAAAAGLVPVIGTTSVLYVDAATFFVSAALIAAGLRGVPQVREATESPSEGYFAELRAGFRLVGTDGLLMALILTVLVTNFLDEPFPAVILPIYADTVLGQASLVGLLVGATGAGAVLGTVGYGALSARTQLSRRAVFLLAFGTMGLVRVVLVALPTAAGAVVALFVAGLASGPVNPLLNTVIQLRVPAAMRARAFGAITAIAFAAAPAGVLAGGLALEAFGLQATLTIVAVAWLIVVARLVSTPVLRELDDDTAAVPSPVHG